MNNYNNSNISTTAKIFENVRCVNSHIGDRCCIGDDSDIDNSTMEEKSELGRRNILRKSLIGRGTYTGTNTIIKNTTTGKYCSIGWNVSIGGGNHKIDNVSMYTDYWYKRTFGVEFNKEISGENEQAEPVIVGNDVWIGSGSNILAGVRLGNGCVIGTGSVVTKDVEPYSIVVGTPGKTIRKRFDNDLILLLEKLQWWNWSEEYIIKNISLLRNTLNKSQIKKLINGGC